MLFLKQTWILDLHRGGKNVKNSCLLTMIEFLPRLRTDVEIIPAYYRGTKGIIVKDSLGLIKEPIFLQEEAINFIRLIDGKRSVADIQLELIRIKKGLFVSSDEVEGLLAELDSSFLLDSDRFRREREKIISTYSSLKVRQAFLAGRTYPGSEAELRTYLDSFFAEQAPAEKINGICGLIAPHIDLEAGKRVYARAYQALKGLDPDMVVLLGTGHALGDSFLSLSEKDFETPLGMVKADREGVRRLKNVAGKAAAAHDLAHRSEHSLEFQLLFLQYLFGSGFLALPILCGSFHQVLNSVSRPSEVPGMGAFLDALRRYVEESSRKTLVIAGVDFSHIGPKFGHRQRASALLWEAKNHDQALIDFLSRGDVLGFWSEVRRVRDRYNVCGFSSLSCLLELFPGKKGHLLGYEIWEEEPTHSAVSFAAIAVENT